MSLHRWSHGSTAPYPVSLSASAGLGFAAAVASPARTQVPVEGSGSEIKGPEIKGPGPKTTPAPRPQHPIPLAREASALPHLWSPRILAQVNDQYLKVARVQGEFPWHSHADEDELFLVLHGALTIGRSPEDGGPVTLAPGEAFVVARGVRHNTSALEETWIALIETVTTRHTGEEQTAFTRSIAEQLGQ